MKSLCLALVLVGGCGPRVPVATGDGDDGASEVGGPVDGDGGSVSDPDDGGDAGDGGDDAPSVTDVPAPGVCLQTPDFMCPNGVADCVELACGDVLSPFDENGCLRPQCPCPDGLTCFDPGPLGGCAPSRLRCSDEGTGCHCEFGDCDGTYCVPPDLIPYPCLWARSEGECEESNCQWWPGSRVVVGNVECSCDEVQGVCVPPLPVEPEFATYTFTATPGVAITLPVRFTEIPPGLSPCEEIEPSIACECAMALACN